MRAQETSPVTLSTAQRWSHRRSRLCRSTAPESSNGVTWGTNSPSNRWSLATSGLLLSKLSGLDGVLGEDAAPLRLELGPELRAHVHHGGKFALQFPVVGNARVDENPIVEIPRQVHRVPTRRPRLLDDVDVRHRIEAGGHGPEDLVDVRAVDVVVHHYGPLAVVGAGRAVCRDVENVARMAGITLANLDHCKAGGGASLVIPYAEDVREAAGLERLPDLGRAGDALQQPGLVHRLLLRRARKNRMVAVKDGLDVDVGTGNNVIGVIAHPFAEGPFGLDLSGDHLALDGDLRVRWNRKAGVRALDHLDGLAPDAAGKIVFRHPLRQRTRRKHVKQRILAADHDHFHVLSALEVGVAVNPAMFSLGDLAADGLSVVHLAAIGPQVVPVRVRILGDHQIRSPEIARLVELVMQRNRELEHIHLVALEHMVENGTLLDDLRLDQRHVLHALVIRLDDVYLSLVFQRQAQGEGDSLDRGELSVQGPEPLRIARHLVEEYGRRHPFAALGEHLRHRAHLPVPMNAADAQKLAHSIDLLQPIPQAAVGHFRLRYAYFLRASHSLLPK